MAITVIERPLGHINTTSGTATIFNSAGNAGFTDAFSLSTGNYIHIQSNIENYNGFWYVDKSGGVVRLRQNSTIALVSFIVEVNATITKTIDNKWSCVHLPIVYKLKSDLYPVNSVDPIVTTSSYGFVNGYFGVTHAALAGADALFALDFVKIGDGADGRIFQVVEVISTTVTILNSDGTGSFIDLQKYRNNYHAKVNIYAGLQAPHSWASIKTYELAATLKFIPDNDNHIMFSVNEILKSYVNIINNTLLATLPNNIDAFTMFYITFQELYDQSDGTDITVFGSSVTDDSSNFEGYAANAMLEFKNLYSGYLSEYLIDDATTPAKFLTLFESPTIFEGKYFDISFIINKESSFVLYLKIDWLDSNGDVLVSSPNQLITDYSEGVYRKQIELLEGCTYSLLHEGESYINSQFTTDLDGWTQGVTTDLWEWSDAIGIYLKYITRLQQSESNTSYISHTISIEPGTQIRIRTRFSGAISGNYNMIVYARQDLPIGYSSLIATFVLSLSAELIVDEIITLPISPFPNDTFTEIYFTIEGEETGGNAVFVDYFMVNNASTYYTEENIKGLNIQIIDGSDNVLTEVKRINVDCDCEVQGIYLTWMNNFGAMEYWNFTDGKEYIRNIGDTGETETNIFPNWPRSYDINASVLRKDTFRESNKGILIRSQHLTLDELQAIEYIKSSIVVEIMTSRSDKRRVTVDKDSWVSYKDVDKLYTLSFTVTYTNDIPSLRL